MPTRIFFLRHGETARPDVFHGAESDVELSQRGQRQAEIVATWLAAQRPDGVVCSAMRRAVQTAEPIALACGLPLQQDPRLHERKVGVLSGQPTHHREGLWPDTLRQWLAGQTSYSLPGAESFDEIRDRVLPAWQHWIELYRDRTLVIVAHGMVGKVLLLSLLPGYGIADWHRLGPIPNVGIQELIHEGENWTAVRLNEVLPEVAAL